MKQFSFYDVTGVIAPGMVLIVGAVALFFPNHRETIEQISKVSVGGLGVGLVLAYVVGQLLQAIGNVLETFWWWIWRGLPTDWVRTNNHSLVAPEQRDSLQDQVRASLAAPSWELSSCEEQDWYSITRQIYAAVSGAKKATRVDAFNGCYGLCRGVAASLLVLLAGVAIIDWRLWRREVALAVLVGLAIFRMHRFGVRYGRELFTQFLALPKEREDDDAA